MMMKLAFPTRWIATLLVLFLAVSCADDKKQGGVVTGTDSGTPQRDTGTPDTTPGDMGPSEDVRPRDTGQPDLAVTTPGFMFGKWRLRDGTDEIVEFELAHEEGSVNMRGTYRMLQTDQTGSLGVSTWQNERFSTSWDIMPEDGPAENWSFVGAEKRDDNNLVGNLTAGLGGAVSTAALTRVTE